MGSFELRNAGRGFLLVTALGVAAAQAAGGCGSGTDEADASSAAGPSTSGTGSGGGGGNVTACTVTAKGPLRGSAIALSSDDSRVVVANRDTGSVTVMSIDYADGFPKLAKVAELMVGAEPWQVVIDGCDDNAYVVLRKDQQVVAINHLKTTPIVGKRVQVGSEPTALALTPNNGKLYVSNWVDGTLSVVDPFAMTVTQTVDLNVTIVATDLLGLDISPRPALAHPRGIAITNNGDASDDDETVYATEWFALRTKPENAANLAGSDVNWTGVLYKVAVGKTTASTIDLPPVLDTKFNDAKGNKTGCFPNQVASVSIDGGFAYVTSTCASPVGPTGVFQKGACQVDANCPGGAAGSCVAGSCKGSCVTDADCGVPAVAGLCNVAGGGACGPFVNNARTTTHPGLSIVDLATGKAVTTNLDAPFQDTAQTQTGTVSARVPLLMTDVDFRPGFAYAAAEGTDALFRMTIANGAITKVGSATNNFIDMRHAGSLGIQLPVGLAISKNKGFGFVANEGSRTVKAVDFNTQAVAVGSAGTDFRVLAAAELPASGSKEAKELQGKRLFVTGLGRWSLRGAGFGSCAVCHIDGLTDNVTWYFARGPRQTVSLDGTFASTDPSDQRILNWTAIVDEVADFEGNVRGISGGVGAIVSTANKPCTVATQVADCPNSQVCNAATLTCAIDVKDRINQNAIVPQQNGLQGSTADIADPMGKSAHPHSVIADWEEVTEWVKTVRSPRAPTNLSAKDVDEGKKIFSDPSQGNCIGCHSGAKWTISKLFYTPGDVPNDAFNSMLATSLSTKNWNKPVPGFPAALFPSAVAGGKTFMRSGAPPGFEQIQCILRPVGTIKANGAVPIGVSRPEVNVLELRQDMVSGGQGAGGTNANDFTTGFNPPSLLGMQVGAPYFHAGNARTLEELFLGIFAGHHQSAIAQQFNPSPDQLRQLVAFLLSIDETTTPFAPVGPGASGGNICAYP
jgi:YVTN family beta-propeller protein